MAGINQGRPEVAVGEPIRFGDIDGFELEQHPVSDRLIIRDTQNGKVAYVRKERGGEIDGDGVLIKALKESKPMADDGRTYDTIQQAEREATGWVFVPPGTYDGNIDINTSGLTLKGCGYNTFIDGGTVSNALSIREDNVYVSNISVSTTAGGGNAYDVIYIPSDNVTVENVIVRESDRHGIDVRGDRGTLINCKSINADGNGLYLNGSSNNIVTGCKDENSGNHGINIQGDRNICSNNIVISTAVDAIQAGNPGDDNIIIGNRVNNAGRNGIRITTPATDNMIANNRISGSGNSDIEDDATTTLLDGNLTGASN